MPGAALLLPDAYDKVMEGATDVKDLGSGVIGGLECDQLDFRAEGVDWQIWIAQGEKPPSLPLRDYRQPGRPRSAIQHPNFGLEDGRRCRGGRL